MSREGMARDAREAALRAAGPRRLPLARATCGTCGGPAARSPLGGRWLHLNSEDWHDHPHNVDPIDVVLVEGGSS